MQSLALVLDSAVTKDSTTVSYIKREPVTWQCVGGRMDVTHDS